MGVTGEGEGNDVRHRILTTDGLGKRMDIRDGQEIEAPYRRTYSSRERLNVDSDKCELWLHPGDRHASGSSGNTGRPVKPAAPRRRCVTLDGELLPLHHTCQLSTCDRITINVSGKYFETWRKTLEDHPNTLLGDPDRRSKYYDKYKDEYFFDRHRPTFDAIFEYYLYGGNLKRPPPVPDDVFLTELDFFEIERPVIEKYRRGEGYIIDNVVLPERGFKRKVWMLMEYPETSIYAYIIAIVSVLITTASIALFCVETLPGLSSEHCVQNQDPNWGDPFFLVETICSAWFTFEVLIRLFACPSKIAFFKDFKNLVDVTAVVPYYVGLFNILSTMSCDSAKSSASLAFLRVFRLVRIFKLTKHSAGLQVLILTFKASVEGLCLFLVALTVCILVFSSAVYFAEMGIEGSQIKSIPDGFWWAIITMTTVGYGDVAPKGPMGKLLGSMCAVAGVLTLAIPVPIITENFNKFYSHKTGRGRI
ncbi:Potassium voltage-gated channel sub A member 1 [Bulinus truncatus]|nr:Potassium voltage-gated channel sub A member 1 [Bulinus truncatus]